MGIKKYELITDGADKRIKALRSFQVQDRYVNIGDVGGIVYDEKTLSQDGNAWIFKGNLGYPTVRVSGDAVVDFDEVSITSPKPLVTIDGQSQLIGGGVVFTTLTTASSTLTAAEFEQGTVNYAPGTNWETWKQSAVNYCRTKTPIYVGGSAQALSIEVTGYTFICFWLDRDGNGVGATAITPSGAGVNIPIPNYAVYMVIRMTKDPAGTVATPPSEVTTAQPKVRNRPYLANVLIRDSRLAVNSQNAGQYVNISSTVPSGELQVGVDNSFVNSKVEIVKGAATQFMMLAANLVNTNATINMPTGTGELLGQWDNVKNLQCSGEIGVTRTTVGANRIITAKDCQDFAYSSTVFPGAAAAQTANRPFRFVRCNVPDGRFYDHAQILNQYTDIDFSKATADLGKQVSGYFMGSSEVQGMYRISSGGNFMGPLVESFDSVANLTIPTGELANLYNTTIYKDAYIRGSWSIAGTNVFGRARSHDNIEVLNVAGRSVQGMFNATAIGGTITGVTPTSDKLCIPVPFRLNSALAISINAPSNIESQVFVVDAQNKILTASSWGAGNRNVSGYVTYSRGYIAFRIANGTSISVADLKDASITVYRGCKIINTDSAAKAIKGNVRIEDDAHVLDTSITGTGYFGGFSTIQGAIIVGCAYMKDNAVCAIPNKRTFAELCMTDNSLFIGNEADTTNNIILSMSDNAKVYSNGRVNVLYCRIRMEGDSAITGGALSSNSLGTIRMKDKATLTGGSTVCTGNITLCGSYAQQSGNKTWTGKRVIFDVNTPEYSNNVKTQYDF